MAEAIDLARAWVGLLTNEDEASRAFFQASTYWVLGNGMLILFWVDRWLLGRSILDLALDLVVVVST
jgi:hypothetical protein